MEVHIAKGSEILPNRLDAKGGTQLAYKVKWDVQKWSLVTKVGVNELQLIDILIFIRI
jgi:hypothetical protein